VYIYGFESINVVDPSMCSGGFSAVRRVDGAFVRVVVVIRALLFALFLFSGLLGTLGGFLFLLNLLADGLDFLHVESRSVLLAHEGQFSRFASHVSLSDATLLFVLLLKHQQSLDFDVFLRLGPLADGISLLRSGGDTELDERLKASQEPVLDELGEDDLELSSGGVNLLSEVVGKVEDDLDELKEHDLSSLDVDKVLTDHLLPPVFHELGSLSVTTGLSSILFNLWVVSDLSIHLGASNNLFLNFDALSFLGSTESLSLLDRFLTLGEANLPGGDISVNLVK